MAVPKSAGELSRRELLGVLSAAGVGALASGCGYSLAGRGSFLPSYIQVIGIPMFVNQTPVPTIEQLFTERVRIEFQSRGRYTVNPDETGADGVVRGTLTGLGAVPVGFTEQQLARRYRFTVSIAVQFFDTRQQKNLWENPALTFSDEYDLQSGLAQGTSPVAFLDQERSAVERLATDFARSVVTAILEAF